MASQSPTFAKYIIYKPKNKSSNLGPKGRFNTGFPLMWQTVVKEYPDYPKYGFNGVEPCLLDLILDYVDVSNRSIKDNDKEMSKVEAQMSTMAKVNTRPESELMNFDDFAFWEDLKKQGIYSPYIKKYNLI